MKFFRRKKIITKIGGVIAIAIIHRSLIAPGFMISASAEDGLALIFCDGPVSLISKAEDHTAGHHHNSEVGEVQQEVHISPICTHWATSSILVVNTLFVSASVFEALSVETTHDEVPLVEQSVYISRYIRGPPYHS